MANNRYNVQMGPAAEEDGEAGPGGFYANYAEVEAFIASQPEHYHWAAVHDRKGAPLREYYYVDGGWVQHKGVYSTAQSC